MNQNLKLFLVGFTYSLVTILLYELIPEFIQYHKSRFLILLPILLLTMVIPFLLTLIIRLTKIYLTEGRIIFSLLMLSGLAGYVIADYWRIYKIDKEFETSSQITKGVVIEENWDTRSWQWQIRCEFYVDDKKYKTFLRGDLNDAVKLNDSLAIEYLTRNPEISKIIELENPSGEDK